MFCARTTSLALHFLFSVPWSHLPRQLWSHLPHMLAGVLPPTTEARCRQNACILHISVDDLIFHALSITPQQRNTPSADAAPWTPSILTARGCDVAVRCGGTISSPRVQRIQRSRRTTYTDQNPHRFDRRRHRIII
jgi:hypothetical protein